MPPALFGSDRFPVSAVICYDGNVNDLVRPVARAGGVLAIPANDWKEIGQLHSPSLIWVAVMTGVPLIRSTGCTAKPGGDRIGPSSQPNGSLKNDSGKANGGGGIGVAAPAQSIAYPPLSPWPWVPRVRFAPRGASAGPGPPRLPGPPAVAPYLRCRPRVLSPSQGVSATSAR